MLAWMMTLNRKKDESLWRLALPKHIIKQLGEYRYSILFETVHNGTIGMGVADEGALFTHQPPQVQRIFGKKKTEKFFT